MLPFLYLCTMANNNTSSQYEFFASFFLPDGMLDWFEITNVKEEANSDSKDLDVLFPNVLHIYLDERDNREGENLGLKPNGFSEYTTLQDYPIRNRKVMLHVRRRRYKDADGHNVIINNYPLKSDGTEISVVFGLFFIEGAR